MPDVNLTSPSLHTPIGVGGKEGGQGEEREGEREGKRGREKEREREEREEERKKEMIQAHEHVLIIIILS